MIALIILQFLASYATSLKVNLQSEVIERIADQQVAQGGMTKEQADQLKDRAAEPSIGGKIAGSIFSGLIILLIALIVAAVAVMLGRKWFQKNRQVKEGDSRS
jgi:NADH:ubiquinone oxidoreductase subunit H